MTNFKLTIEYDGTAYHGWQRQKNDRTVQEEIEKALMTMTGKKVTLTGSGRTDAGVHALGQVANFHCNTKLTPDVFQKGLNSLTDRDIVIRECTQADETFHARYDAKSKTYNYKILNRLIPAAVSRQYVWFIRKKLNISAMRSAILHIIGTHDFKAFEGAGSPRSHTTRCILNANLVEQDDGYLLFEIEANGFLKFMVRNIVGTLADVGHDKITPDDFKDILLSKDRDQAGPTAPPQGLFLMNVRY
ncbi:tRNA pseudouridine(38-40) synthase TruA [Desulfonema magnum]|uniref:tRNA pseudouridine synthase A n=1 Tax=Desulfonema magnum TaxID=45655 RepID=A0A975BR13_9BACT|nr:tRNA pseudouridine(38-40) synthase TruA [Desulfonema magnum]QTA90274.1 tRNA pseudouridine synthase A [Desulfonema magnum]